MEIRRSSFSGIPPLVLIVNGKNRNLIVNQPLKSFKKGKIYFRVYGQYFL